ncbi:MAG: PHP domain-containing protein [Chloroflexota bacterium]
MKADLHIHSTYSDGRLNPWEIVQMAADSGTNTIAITDHDSVAGIDLAVKAAAAFPRFHVIPGVEMATNIPEGNEVHILGYFIDYNHRLLLDFLESQRRYRDERAARMLEKLAVLGIHIDFKQVKELAVGESLGRPHIARAMAEAGYVSSIRDAFIKYIGSGGPAYVARDKVSTEEIINLTQKVGGVAVMAHPLEVRMRARELEGLIAQLKAQGLMGLEAYYDGYPLTTKIQLAKLAHKYDLLALGGSDYHGLDIDDTPLGGVEIPDEEMERFLALEKRQVHISH